MMDLDMKWWFLIGGGALLLFIVLNRSLKKPFLLIGYGVMYSVVGAMVLFLVNMVGQYIHLSIPINMVTAFITGVLGLPGIAYLVIVKLVFLA